MSAPNRARLGDDKVRLVDIELRLSFHKVQFMLPIKLGTFQKSEAHNQL